MSGIVRRVQSVVRWSVAMHNVSGKYEQHGFSDIEAAVNSARGLHPDAAPHGSPRGPSESSGRALVSSPSVASVGSPRDIGATTNKVLVSSPRVDKPLPPDQEQPPPDEVAHAHHAWLPGATCLTPVQRWQDPNWQYRPLFVEFDDPNVPRPGLAVAYLSGVGVAVLLGLTLSLGFILIGPFPIAGFPGSTRADNVLCALGGFLGILPIAHWLTFYDPELSTFQWFLYFAAFAFVPMAVVRCVVVSFPVCSSSLSLPQPRLPPCLPYPSPSPASTPSWPMVMAYGFLLVLS